MQTTGRWYWKPLLCQLSHKHFKITLCIIFWVVTVVIMALITTFCYKILFRLLGWRIVCGLRQQITLKTLWEWRWWSARSPSSLTIQVRCMLTSWLFFFVEQPDEWQTNENKLAFVYDRAKNNPAHAWQRAMHVQLLVQSGCLSPSVWPEKIAQCL